MKEKETYLFREQWETAREAVIKEVVDSYGPIPWPAKGTFEGGGCLAMDVERIRRRRAEKSNRVKQWECENPRPAKTRDEIIVELWKKGGSL